MPLVALSTEVVTGLFGLGGVLVGAGLFLRSLQNLRGLDPGFRPQGVLTLRLDLGARDYQRAQQIGFWRAALARARALPGVDSASLSALSPLDGLREDGRGGSRPQTRFAVPVPWHQDIADSIYFEPSVDIPTKREHA